MDSTYKLIRCSTVNRKAEHTIRLVELSSFKLWKYMMENEHGLEVNNITLCLWMNRQVYQAREAVNARGGVIEAVDRLVVTLYNPENGFTEEVVRYSPHHETDQMKSLLLSHASDDLKQTDGVEVDICQGYCVIKSGATNSLQLGLASC